jgi:hypothetical protein
MEHMETKEIHNYDTNLNKYEPNSYTLNHKA